MGILRPHVSRHVSGRAPRRGRRPRRPVFRSPIAGCTRVLHVCLRRPYFFQQRKKYGKERRQKPTVFGFPFRPIATAVQKGSALDRLHFYPHCRSRVPRLNAPMGTPHPHVSRHVSGRAPRRGRRPRRPASAHHRIPVYSRLILRRGGVLPRPPPIFCFRMYASGGHISFNSERNMEKNAAKNRWFLDFPFVQL